MRAQNLGFTYKPKIERVQKGTIRQTIRKGRRFKVGMLLHLFTWSGKPRHSKWGWRRDERCNELYNILITKDGFICEDKIDEFEPTTRTLSKCFYSWERLTWIAELDGIEPPTGIAMGELFNKMHELGDEGTEFQIVRW